MNPDAVSIYRHADSSEQKAHFIIQVGLRSGWYLKVLCTSWAGRGFSVCQSQHLVWEYDQIKKNVGCLIDSLSFTNLLAGSIVKIICYLCGILRLWRRNSRSSRKSDNKSELDRVSDKLINAFKKYCLFFKLSIELFSQI